MQLGQVLRFASVGAVATATHYGIAVGAILMGVTTLSANAAGFACALVLGFLGHYHFTFRRSGSGAWQPLMRYCTLSLSSFAVAQGLLWGLVQLPWIPAPVAVLMVMVLVAAANYVLSRYWAFALPKLRRVAG